MSVRDYWVSHPHEWQPLLDQWAREFPEYVTLHAWRQFAPKGDRCETVRGLTLGDDGRKHHVRLLVAVPHAHEPAPTAAILDLAAQFLTGGNRPSCLLTLLPDTNAQGRARSPRRVWDGELDNDTFMKIVFGEAENGERFGRYPEWRMPEHRARSVGIIYEQIESGLYVEPNTSRRSTHSRALDELFARYHYTHFLDMHQHEGDEAALLPAAFDDLPPERQAPLATWADAILTAWQTAGIRHKGKYVPYPGHARQQFFRDFWAGRCPGMLHLMTETRNNRHTSTGERTSQERQFRSASIALSATLRFLQDQ